MLTKDEIGVENRKKVSKNWQLGIALHLLKFEDLAHFPFFTHDSFLLQNTLQEYHKYTLHDRSEREIQEEERRRKVTLGKGRSMC